MGEIIRQEIVKAARVQRAQKRIVEASAALNAVGPEQLEYLHAILCQVNFPRKKTDALSFERVNGGVWLKVQAGELWGDNGKSFPQPLPYGVKPRLMLVYLSSEAVRTKSRTVEIGRSMRGFMERLGFETNGSQYRSMKIQIQALAACWLTLGFTRRINGATAYDTVKAPPIEGFRAWHDELISTGQDGLIPGEIVLSQTFFDGLIRHAVPLDSRALAALKHSSLALDLYSWLAHRLCRIKSRQDLFLDWRTLREQFGPEYTDLKNFNPKLLQALRQVLVVYPKARVEIEKQGLRLKHSHPPIQKNQIVKLRLDLDQP